MTTIQDSLNNANPTNIADRFRQVSIGDVLAGMAPPLSKTLSGLASSATHVHDVAARIWTVDLAGTNLEVVAPAATPGAGEVGVTYDAAGVATLVFGDGANTAYTVTETPMLSGLAAILATSVETSV